MMKYSRKKPSKQQLQALALIGQGVQPTKAMLKAGYSEHTSRNPKQNLLKSPTILTIIEQMDLELENEGITIQYLARKLSDFAKSTNPKVFMSAYDRIKELKGIEKPKQESPQPVRKWEFTEWVNDSDAPSPFDKPTQLNTEDSTLSAINQLNDIELNKYDEIIEDEEPTLIEGQPID